MDAPENPLKRKVTDLPPTTKQVSQPWTPEEDALLQDFVAKHGDKGRAIWQRCSEYLDQHGCKKPRTENGCKNRYIRYIKAAPTEKPTPAKPVTVSVGIQTCNSFSPRDTVIWAKTPEVEENKAPPVNIEPSPSLKTLLTSGLPDCQEDIPSLKSTISCVREPTRQSDQPEPRHEEEHNYYASSKTKAKSATKKKKTKELNSIKALSATLNQESSALTKKNKHLVKVHMESINSVQTIASNVLKIQPLRDAIVSNLAKDLGLRPEKMRSRKCGELSVLMKKSFDDMRSTNLGDIAIEFHQKFPELFAVILAIMHPQKPPSCDTIMALIPRLAMVYGITLQARVEDLSRLQSILTAGLTDQICKQTVYDRLNRVGVTLSHTSALEISKKISTHFKDQLKEEYQKGNRIRLIGDNLNFTVGVAHESKDRHKHMVHMFASAAIISPDWYAEGKDTPQMTNEEFDLDKVSLSNNEYATMQKDMIGLVAKVMDKYLPQLQFIQESMKEEVRPIHKEYCKKTTVIPLPVLNLNEQDSKDVVQILDYYEEVLANINLQEGEKVQTGGDQLTADRFRHGINLRIGNPHPPERFAHLGPVTFEFFHLSMNFLEKIVYDILWHPSANPEKGTLHGEQERIFRHSVNPDVHKAYAADKNFFISFVTAYLVEALQDFFGLESRTEWPTKHVPPCFADGAEQKTWVLATMGEFIDKYCFPYWSGNDKEPCLVHEVVDEVQYIVRKLPCGLMVKVPFHQESVTVEDLPPDRKKLYGHYVLESGLTFMYFLDLCKKPDRARFLAILKVMMLQLKAKTTQAKYPLEILRMLHQQYVGLAEKDAERVLHACFVNTKGHTNSNVPADLQMEWIVKQNKEHVKHMYANKNTKSIALKSAALPGLHTIATNFDEEADVVKRSKVHKAKDPYRDEIEMMDGLREIRPFETVYGRSYTEAKFAGLPISPAKKLNAANYAAWFEQHKAEGFLF